MKTGLDNKNILFFSVRKKVFVLRNIILDYYYWQLNGSRERLDGVKQFQERCYLGFVVVFQRYGYISLFLPCVDIAMSFDNLLQRIASINHRLYLSRLNQVSEEN